MFQRACMRMAAYMLVALSVLAASGCRAAKEPEAQPVVPELKLDGVRFRIYRGRRRSASSETPMTCPSDGTRPSYAPGSSTPRCRGRGAPVLITAPEGHGSLLSRVFDVSGRGPRLPRRRRRPDRARPLRAGRRRRRGRPRATIRSTSRAAGYRLDGVGFTLDPRPGSIEVHGRGEAPRRHRSARSRRRRDGCARSSGSRRSPQRPAADVRAASPSASTPRRSTTRSRSAR